MKKLILSENRRRDLNRMIAEWAGFERCMVKSNVSNFALESWIRRGDKDKRHFYLDFPNSLSNCYEWLVPKMKSFSLASEQGNHVAKIVLENGSKSELTSDSAPLSLCIALENLIIAK